MPERVLLIVGQGPTALAVGAGWGGLNIFACQSFVFSSLSLCLGDVPL